MDRMDDISRLEDACRSRLDLKNASLGEEYHYQSLPLCVIDAVYSIGVTYKSTQNTVDKYCGYFGLEKIRADRKSLPAKEFQEPITAFIEKYDKYGITGFGLDIFKNMQRTSTTNGVLKAEVVYDFSLYLNSFGVEYFQDLGRIIQNKEFEKEIRYLPGQASGISLRYFFMLAGSDDLVKPDRHIEKFLADILGRKINPIETQVLLTETAYDLKNTYPNMTPRLLDHEIWKYQRIK